MAKQIIDIGVQGNDGTGDSIRESFRKVNENFTEIYAVFGVGGTIRLKDLDDGVAYHANQVIMGNNTGSSLSARTLVAGTGISIDTTSSDTELTINSDLAGLVGDSNPTLSAPINAMGKTIGRVAEPSDALVATFNALYPTTPTTIDQLVVTKGYADKNYLRVSSSGDISAALIVRDQPIIPELSNVNYDPTLTSNYLSTEVMQRRDTVYRGGDTMTGKLYLSDHPSPMEGDGTPNSADDLQAATKYYVDNNTYSSNINLYVSTTNGDDLQQKTPLGKEGRYWHYAYKTIGAAALQAENLINLASQEPGPYKQRISYTSGPDQTFSTIQNVTLTNGNTAVPGYQDAFDLLQANRSFLQAETIAYINNKYVNAFTYDKVKCQRDLGLIIDGVGYDLVQGGTYNTVRAASAYYNATAETVLSAQLLQTIDAITYTRDQILNFSFNDVAVNDYISFVIDSLCYDLVFQGSYQSVQAGLAFASANTNLSEDEIIAVLYDMLPKLIELPEVSSVTTAVQLLSKNIDRIVSVIRNTSAITVEFPNLPTTTVGQKSAKNLITNNIAFVQAEIVGFLNAEYPNLSYSKETCKRDIKYIMWSIVYDFMYGGNSQSVYAGKRYWNDALRNIADIEVSATVASIHYINTLLQAIIANERPEILYQQSVIQYQNNTLINGVEVSSSISNNIDNIASIVQSNATIAVVYPNVSAGAAILGVARDAIQAEKATIQAAEVAYINDNFSVIDDPVVLQTITDLFQIVIDLFNNGIATRPAVTYVDPAGQELGVTNARLLIIGNIDFLADETVAWAQSNYTGLGFDPEKCRRDVKYIVEAVSYDITYGGNSASAYAGLQYWQNGVDQVAGQEVATHESIVFLQNLIQLVINNEPPLITYSSTPQFIDLELTNGGDAISIINTAFDSILSTLDTGTEPTIIYPSLIGYSSSILNIRQQILNNKELIAAQTTNYIDTTYVGGFSYDESVCFRDVGYIVDAISIDVITDGTYQSIEAGKSYYRNASARAVAIGTQLTETLDAITFLQNLITQVLEQTTATRYQTLVNQYLNGSMHSAPSAVTFANANMDTIVSIIRYGLGAAPAANLGSGIWEIVIDNGGMGYVDQGQPGNTDIIPAKVIVGVGSDSIAPSGAYASIVKYIPNSDTSVDTIQVRLTKPGFFKIGEQLEFGETVKDLHITIFTEAGIYYEDYPIRLPSNVTVKGDDFRRSIIRPRNRISQSPWRKIFFYRDAIIDAMELGPYNYDTDYAAVEAIGADVSLGGTSNVFICTLSSGQVPQSWIGKVLMDDNSPKRGRAVIDAVSGNTFTVSTIYPFESSGTLTSGNWHIYGTINYGRFYLTDPLDITSTAKNNRDIDAFLCGDATRITNITFQGHGGFAMVLDPEGQIKTKSPYGQVCSSFSQSNNSKRFAGGQFVDGFTGRLFGTITNVADDGITLTVQGGINSGLDVRPPQPPCAFYSQGVRYQINDVVSWSQSAFTFNEDKCSRDVGLILTAVLNDAELGTNYNSIVAGLAYLRSYTSTVTSSQKAQTIAGLNYARDLAVGIATNSTTENAIANNIAIVTSIINGGSVPALSFTNPAGVSNSALGGFTQLRNNRTFLTNEVIGYIADNLTPGSIPGYDADICARDTGYLIDAIAYDILYGGNTATITAAQAYYNGVASVVGSENAAFTSALTYLKSVIDNVVNGDNLGWTKTPSNTSTQSVSGQLGDGASASKAQTLTQNIIDIVVSGLGSTPASVDPTYTAGSNYADVNVDKTNIVSGITAIQSSVIDFLNATYPSSGGVVVLTLDVNTPYNPATMYNNTTCARDVGLILDAITYDLVTGSNYQTIKAGMAYLRADANKVVNLQQGQTVAGVTKARDLALSTIPGSTYAASRNAISLSIATINNVLTQGIDSVPTITYPANANSTTNAQNLTANLQENRTFIRSEITAYIAATYVIKNITGYSAAKCSRDVGYMIDAICYDIMYGGNSATFDALLSYYGRSIIGETGSAQITAQEQAIFANTFTRFKTVVLAIATNATVTKTNGNSASQIITPAYAIAGGSDEYIKLGQLSDLIIDYTPDGVTGTSRTTTTLTGLNATALAARTAIENAKTSIKNNVISYLNSGGGLQINIEMGGNKSMLANDFAMINDLGYGILCTNGGVSEQVSTFTYYCHTHYWANNGGQIRSVAGSNSHGNYGLRASGYDVTEKPDSVVLPQDMIQVARVYKQGIYSNEMTPTTSKQSLALYILGYSYTPYGTSELEIDHTLAGLGIVRYEVSSVEHTTVTINGQNVLKLNLSTAGNAGTSSTGLAAPLYHGQQLVIRNLSQLKFINIDNVKPTRPSTALQYTENLGDIYRVVAYNLNEPTGELLDPNVAVLQTDSSFNYYKFVTDKTYLTELDPDDPTKTQGSKLGDNKIAVQVISKQSTIDQVNKGKYITAWNGRVHLVTHYTPPVNISSAVYVSGGTGASTTMIVSNVSGNIQPGNVITGTGFTLGQTVVSVSLGSPTSTIELSAPADGSPTGSIEFGTFKNGYITIDPNPINNVVGDGTGVAALTYNSKTTVTGKTLVTFDVPWTPESLPIVDANYLIANQANTAYNGYHQSVGSVSKTVLTVPSTADIEVGMIVSSASAGTYIPSGTIVQSVDDLYTFTVSPACWIPASATVNASLVAVVSRVDITFPGTGYSSTNPPIITIEGGGATVQAIATCTVSGGSIETVTLVSQGYGYTSQPTVSVSYGNAILNVVLTSNATTSTTASAGVSTNQITLAYDSDPGTFTLGASKTFTGFTSTTPTTYNGVNGYSVVLAFASGTLTTSKYYKIAGNSNPLYDGLYICTASTTGSATFFFAHDPGTWGTGTTTATLEVTSATTTPLGINSVFPSDAPVTLRIGYPAGTPAQITTRISTCRATGHDFLDVGTGSYSTTNYPYQIYGNPSQSKQQSQEISENGVGRCFYVSTDQNGIFRVGRFFTVDQGTGTVTFSASIALSNLDGLGFKKGVVVSEFSTDSTFTSNASEIVPVQSAIRGYIDKRLGLDHGGAPISVNSYIGPGFVPLNGIVSMTGNLIMDQHRITNVGTPTASGDATNKAYVDAQVAGVNALSKLNDANITSPTNGAALTYDLASSKWVDASLPTGDVNITYSAGTLTATIQSNKITNDMVKSDAAIAQSKLALNDATAAATAGAATKGIVSFDSGNFVSTTGFVSLKASSVTRGQLATISNNTILGNFTGGSTNPQEVTAGTVVTQGDGIKNANFVASGAMLVSYDGSNTSNNTYTVVGVTTNRAANSLLKTLSNGEIDTSQLKVDGFKTIDTSGTSVQFYTPDGFNFASATGSTGSNTTTTTYGTLDTSNGTLKATTFTTGAPATAGTITGQWSVLSSSQIDFTAGTLKTTTLTTGADATAGSIQGTWSLVGASKLQATYADLAEYYEGDKEYEPGTVLVFGGDKEVTTTTQMNDTRSAGVVTTDPAYVMNAEQTGIKVCLALAGRVPCKVVGRVKKGDMLTTSATPGYAVKASTPTLGSIIGKALEDKDYGEAGVIQVAVGRV